MNIKDLNPTYAAQRMWQEGQSTESNPHPKGSDKHEEFNREIRRLEHNELLDMLGQSYA